MVYETLGVTGSRFWVFKKESVPEVKTQIKLFLEHFKSQGGKRIIQGGALGVDTWAALTALDIGLQLITYVPYPDQTGRWTNQEDKTNYEKILKSSVSVKTFGDHQDNKLFFARNSGIVKDSDLIFAVIGSGLDRGATWTAKEAQKQEKPLVVFKWESDLSFKKGSKNISADSQFLRKLSSSRKNDYRG